ALQAAIRSEIPATRRLANEADEHEKRDTQDTAVPGASGGSLAVSRSGVIRRDPGVERNHLQPDGTGCFYQPAGRGSGLLVGLRLREYHWPDPSTSSYCRRVLPHHADSWPHDD